MSLESKTLTVTFNDLLMCSYNISKPPKSPISLFPCGFREILFREWFFKNSVCVMFIFKFLLYLCCLLYVLYMCACMYTCMHVCLYVYVCMCPCVCIYVWHMCMHGCLHVCMYTCMNFRDNFSEFVLSFYHVETWDVKSGWWQMLLPAEPSLWPI